MLRAFGWKNETELEKSVKRLKANDPSLTELNLYYNSIGDDGAKAIAEALKVNPNTVLTTLCCINENLLLRLVFGLLAAMNRIRMVQRNP